MITLEIKVNGKLIGMRTATRIDGAFQNQSEYIISPPAGGATVNIKHGRKTGAVKLAELMLATMADNGTRNLAWK